MLALLAATLAPKGNNLADSTLAFRELATPKCTHD